MNNKTAQIINVSQCIDKTIKFIENNRLLIDANVSNFLIHNQWYCLVKSDLRTQLEKYDYKDLFSIPQTVLKCTKSSQDEVNSIKCSLSNLKTCTGNYSQETPKKKEYNKDSSESSHFSDFPHFLDSSDSPKSSEDPMVLFLNGVAECSIDSMGILSDISTFQTGIANSPTSELMSPKKKHEITVMSDVCETLYQRHKADLVLDVGSGKGYLGTELSIHRGLRVFSVDACSEKIKSAIQRHRKISMNWRGLGHHKAKPSHTGSSDKQSHVESFVDQDTHSCDRVENTSEHYDPCLSDTLRGKCDEKPRVAVTTGDFSTGSVVIDERTDLSDLIPSTSGAGTRSARVLLTGLHACGPLTRDILKMFVNSDRIACVCVVGCCYNFLSSSQSQESPENYEHSFPMSSYLRSKHFRLSNAAFNLACQSLPRIATHKKLQGEAFFDRALLQLIVRDVTGLSELPAGAKLRNLAKRSTSTYDYMCRAFAALGLSADSLTPGLIDDYVERHSRDRLRLSAFCQLRCVLAPCVETVILLDRLLWLLERDATENAHLVELFDPKLSPRCYALIASKQAPSATPPPPSAAV